MPNRATSAASRSSRTRSTREFRNEHHVVPTKGRLLYFISELPFVSRSKLHEWEFRIRSPQISNSDCLPCRAGGTPMVVCTSTEVDNAETQSIALSVVHLEVGLGLLGLSNEE
jgi:hypothetical protein